jgi:predicted regulator of Ras-like GTPase activity (Roadblock/LC7/MglB family)
MEGQLSSLVITKEGIGTIDELFSQYLVDSQAKDIILLNKSGELLAKSGAVTRESAIAVSALAAGVFSATNELAKLLGEHEFTLTFHQGKETNIHISLVDPLILLAVIFDNKAPIGAIRFWARKISGSIKPVLEKMASGPRQEPSQDLRKGLQDEIDDLF